MSTDTSNKITPNEAIANATLEQIENKIMTHLIINEDKPQKTSELYNKVLDKYDYKGGCIDSEFKYKFALAVKNIDSNENVIKTDSGAVYTTKPFEHTNKLNSNNQDIVSNVLESEKSNDECVKDITNIKTSELYEYVNKKMPDKIDSIMKYIDPVNGNTIYHDFVIESSINYIDHMLVNNTFNFDIKNKNNNTPVDYINDIVVARLFIKNLIVKLQSIKKQMDNIKNDQTKLNKQLNNLRIIQNIFIVIALFIIICRLLSIL